MALLRHFPKVMIEHMFETFDDPEVLEAAVLRLLLVEHPAQLTRAEIERELGRPDGVPGAVEEAIRRLVGAGLAHRNGEFVLPSRAALRFDELPLD